MLVASLVALVLVAQSDTGMVARAPGGIEGRPPASAASPIQTLVDRAEPGSVVDVPSGTYRGDLYIDKSLTLAGHGRPLLVASGAGSVVRVRADDVTIEGFAIDGRLAGSLAGDASGIHVTGQRATIRDVQIDRAHFGIYLRDADSATIERATIRGVRDMPAGEQGSGIHIYNSQRFHLRDNDIADVRDGIYIQSSSGGRVERTSAVRLRYGLHYMFSDDNVFEDNRFEDGAAGAALMYSKRLTFRRNRFWHNRGYASVGLLLKDCEAVVAEDNLIADNARGLFLEGSDGNVFQRNLVAVSDVAIVLFDSSHGNTFHANAFIANLSPLSLVGRRSDTDFDGNYWSDASALDLDADGIGDRPYRLTSVFDHFRGNMRAADLFASGPAAHALAVAEHAFPVLQPISVVDRRPLIRPPALERVPIESATRQAGRSGLGLATAVLVFGGAILGWARRPQTIASAS